MRSSTAAVPHRNRPTAARIRAAALAAYRALGLRDYARIDQRLPPDGDPYVIEANPNPWLVSQAEFALAAREAGRSFTELIGEIVDLAVPATSEPSASRRAE